MKKLPFILFCFISIASTAQIRLGYSLDSIKVDFPQSVYETEIGKADDGVQYLLVHLADAALCYYFDDEATCFSIVLQPFKKKDIKMTKKKYNENYSIISKNKWRAHYGINDVDIDFIEPENGSHPYFLWIYAFDEN